MADDTRMLTLEKPVAGGRALARLDGRVVLVSGGIPGERVLREGVGVLSDEAAELVAVQPEGA